MPLFILVTRKNTQNNPGIPTIINIDHVRFFHENSNGHAVLAFTDDCSIAVEED